MASILDLFPIFNCSSPAYNKDYCSYYLAVPVLFLIQGIFSPSAIAQVTTDGTTNSSVNANGNNFTIQQGDRVDNNLFHSFSDFSVPNDGSAFFNNATDIVNIFSRVTSGNISNIDGLLRANGNANFFLLNPNGIIFGEGASLDLGGSFFGSTAESFLFEDGSIYSATNPAETPLLTVNVPIGLQYGSNPNPIEIRGANLAVLPGQNLTLVGGDINSEGGIIIAPGGRVELGGLSTTGEIGINPDSSLSFPDGIVKADVSLTNQAEVRVRSGNGGAININANQLELAGESLLAAGIATGLGSPETQANNITIDVNAIFARGNSEIRNENLGMGNAGDINITTGTLEFSEGSAIVTSTFGQGNAGEVNITATEDVSFDGNFGGIFSTLGLTRFTNDGVPNAIGDGGNIKVVTNSLSLGDGSRFQSNTEGRGNAGDITINTSNLSLSNSQIITNASGTGDAGNIILNVNDTISLDQSSDFSVLILAQASGQGNAGNIEINAGNLVAQSDGLSSRSLLILTNHQEGIGNSGNITVNTTNSIYLDRTVQLSTTVSNNVVGNAGTIEIKTNSLFIDGSLIQANTLGQGNAGNIIINANDISIEQESLILSQVLRNAQGEGGEIRITGDNITLQGNSFVSTNTEIGAMGDAGDIILNGETINIIEDAGLNSLTRNAFNSGDIIVTTRVLEIASGGDINVSTFSEGNAGDLTITAQELILITGVSVVESADDANRSGLSADSLVGNGSSGDINILTNQLIIDDGGTIEAGDFTSFGSASENPGTGPAGNINIKANFLSLNNEARIQATTQSEIGDSANINLEIAKQIILQNGSFISARANENADGGNIDIDTNFIIALPNQNNDILANAGEGEGGNIDITAKAIFGLEDRPLNDLTNDINASSELGVSGTVVINNPDIDPTSELVELPDETTDPSDHIIAGCAADSGNSFAIVGKGGLPEDPTNIVRGEGLLSDLRDFTNSDNGVEFPTVKLTRSPKQLQGAIVQVKGWLINSDGEVELVAALPQEKLSTNYHSC